MLLKIFPTMLVFSKLRNQKTSDCFSFKLVTIEDICKEIRALDASDLLKVMTYQPKLSNIIPTVFLDFFQENFNNTIERSTFPVQLKYADVKPV